MTTKGTHEVTDETKLLKWICYCGHTNHCGTTCSKCNTRIVVTRTPPQSPREAALDELTRLSQDMGMYDLPLDKALSDLINRHSRENVSNTPDWILGDFLLNALVCLETAIQQRETWYGRDAAPQSPAPATPEQGAAQDEREAFARFLHDTYEELAPTYGYITRPETRTFDPDSPNGRLMIAVATAALKWAKGEK